MLVHPKPFAAEIEKIFATKVFPDMERYQYYFLSGNASYPSLADSDWNSVDRISVKDDKILGLFCAGIFSPTRSVNSIEAINLGEKNDPTFARDMHEFLRNLFEVHGMRRISFSFCEENPVAPMYHRLVKKFGGRVVGYHKQAGCLPVGKFVDLTIVEFMRDDYILIKRKVVSQ